MPLAAYPLKDDLNLYTYVGNDPLDKTDPSGAAVEVAYGDGTSPADFQEMRTYLEGSPAFNAQYQVLVKSDNIYTVQLGTSDRFEYNESSRTISINPHSALEFSNGDIQSPAIGFAHEVDHAARHEGEPKQFAKDRAVTQKTTDEGVEVSRNGADEAKAIKFEQRVAGDLHERGRTSYAELVKTKPVLLTVS